LDLAPGETAVLWGVLHSSHDGLRIDAARSFAGNAPGPGLFDFEAGGLRLVSYDMAAHRATVLATGFDAPACYTHGVRAPCLVSRTPQLAHARLLTVEDWGETLNGVLALEVEDSLTASARPRAASTTSAGDTTHWYDATAAHLAIGALLCGALVMALWLLRRGWQRRNLHRRATALERVAKRTDPVLAATLAPSLRLLRRGLRSGRLVATSDTGRTLASALRRLELQLTARQRASVAARERQAADELLDELRIALRVDSELRGPPVGRTARTPGACAEAALSLTEDTTSRSMSCPPLPPTSRQSTPT
jgi:hypothetical protein